MEEGELGEGDYSAWLPQRGREKGPLSTREGDGLRGPGLGSKRAGCPRTSTRVVLVQGQPQTRNRRDKGSARESTWGTGASAKGKQGGGAGAPLVPPLQEARWTSSLMGGPRVAAPGVSTPQIKDRVAQQGAEQGLEREPSGLGTRALVGVRQAQGFAPAGMVAGALPWLPLPWLGIHATAACTQASVLGVSVHLHGQQLLLLQRVPGTHSPHWPDACFTPCWAAQHLGTCYSPAWPG